MGNTLTVESILERMLRLAERLAPYTEKLVFSFLDMYKKTENNLKKVDPLLRPPSEEEALRLAEGIAQINKSLVSPLALSACAEKLDLHPLELNVINVLILPCSCAFVPQVRKCGIPVRSSVSKNRGVFFRLLKRRAMMISKTRGSVPSVAVPPAKTSAATIPVCIFAHIAMPISQKWP